MGYAHCVRVKDLARVVQVRSTFLHISWPPLLHSTPQVTPRGWSGCLGVGSSGECVGQVALAGGAGDGVCKRRGCLMVLLDRLVGVFVVGIY